MNPSKTPGLVLCLHPTSRGFGYALFEGSDMPVQWGCASAPGSSAKAMRRLLELLEWYQPSVLVLEAFGTDSRRRSRIQELAETMIGLARSRDMAVAIYDRPAIGEALLGNPAATRHAVAGEVARRLPVLDVRLPKQRTAADPEDRQQCLFDAVALGLTYYAS
jgi:Holliday junction resolvasome RuvABC endonuclease subunit